MRFFRKEEEVEDGEVIEEACQYLTQIGIEAVPITRYSSDDIAEEKEQDSIGAIAIKTKNLNAIQLYTAVETTGGYSSHSTRYYYIDCLLRMDIGKIGEERFEKLEAYTKFKWRGSILKPTQRELLDLEWIAGCSSGWISIFQKIFKTGRKSELTDALNSDIALKNSLVEEFKKPLVIRLGSKWYEGMEISFAPIEIVADWTNECVRIKLPRKTHKKEALPSLLPSHELMESLDRIAHYIRNVMR